MNEDNEMDCQEGPRKDALPEVNIPPGVTDKGFWEKVVCYAYKYSIAGFIFAGICILAGIVLLLHGVGGSVSWTAKFLGLESRVSDAVPGVILIIIALFIVYITQFRIRSRE